jgi:hypothetical protein
MMGKEGGSAGGRYGGIAGGRAMAERGSGAEPATQRLHCRRYHWLPPRYFLSTSARCAFTHRGLLCGGRKKRKNPEALFRRQTVQTESEDSCARGFRTTALIASLARRQPRSFPSSMSSQRRSGRVKRPNIRYDDKDGEPETNETVKKVCALVVVLSSTRSMGVPAPCLSAASHRSVHTHSVLMLAAPAESETR